MGSIKGDASAVPSERFKSIRLLSALGRRHSRRRQYPGSGELCRQLSGQAVEKRHDVANFGVAELHSELHASHDLHGLRKRRYRSIVEVWRGHCDVAQTGHPEHVKIIRILSHIDPPLVDTTAAGRRPIVFDYPELAIRAPAYADAVVAGDAPRVDECLQALTRAEGQSIDIPSEISVEGR